MKSRIVAALLAFFLGGLGVHKFYLNKNGKGFLYLIFCWTYIPAIISLFEGIGYLMQSDADFQAKHCPEYGNQSGQQYYNNNYNNTNNSAPQRNYRNYRN